MVEYILLRDKFPVMWYDLIRLIYIFIELELEIFSYFMTS